MLGQLVANSVTITAENRQVMMEVQHNTVKMQALFQALEVGLLQ